MPDPLDGPDDDPSRPRGSAGEPPKTVLLIDDHQMFAEGVLRLIDREPDLKSIGMANTAAEGVARAIAERPDVVVMDQQLPDGEGVTAAREILRSAPDTAIVLLSGRADDGLLMAAMRAGCTGFVSKLDAYAELVSAVRLAAAGDMAIPSAKLVGLLTKLDNRELSVLDHSSLSEREIEVLGLLANGRDTRSIADDLVLSEHTVRNHVRNAMSKLGVHTRLEAVTIAARRGLIELQ